VQLQKRQMANYILLNCLTLGIYGFIVSMQMSKEINALCKGDGEEPRFSYAGTWGIRLALPIVGSICMSVIGTVIGFTLCLLAGLVLIGWVALMGGVAGYAFGGLLIAGLLYGAIAGAALGSMSGTILGKVYYDFWWYKQANRLHVNANRFDLTVKEKGSDIFLFRTAMAPLLSPITVLLTLGAWIVPLFILGLLALTKAVILVIIFAVIFAIPFALFRSELTGGATMATYFMFKNINRYANVYKNGARPFDPLGYEYYPSIDNFYIRSLPNFVDGTSALALPPQPQPDLYDDFGGGNTTPINPKGSVSGLSGTCAGYSFDLNPGEEIVIGKDAKMASVVVDTSFKEISRKHVGISYDIIQDVYRVTDYSSNGTWANDKKLTQGVETVMPHGTVLKLANDKNTFRLG